MSTIIAGHNVSTPDPTTTRPRLHYLDGIRGMAALAVVLHHIYWDVAVDGMPFWYNQLFLQLGRFGVDVFIVLSGYCLTIPIAKESTLPMRGGAWGYLKRRARRILPPYYAALAFALLLMAFVPGLRHPSSGAPWDSLHSVLPALSAGPIVSHIFLVHNLNPDWANKIDAPMWSVATEWQIYFFLPLLLLPIWRRLGLVASVVVAIAVGLGLDHLMARVPFWMLSPWFLGLFAIGMAAAGINFGARYAAARTMPWGLFALVASPAMVALIVLQPKWTHSHILLDDFICAVITASLLIACTRRLMLPNKPVPLALRMVGSRPVVGLGLFSYSIYLIHHPLLLTMERTFHTHTHFKALAEYSLLAVCGIPVILICAYAFHRVFERPFMNLPAEASSR